jgi:hypothetical protein
MIETPQLNSGFLPGTIVSLVFVVAYPVVLAVLAHRRQHVGWRYVAYGASVFFVFQLATRVPALHMLEASRGSVGKSNHIVTARLIERSELSAPPDPVMPDGR